MSQRGSSIGTYLLSFFLRVLGNDPTGYFMGSSKENFELQTCGACSQSVFVIPNPAELQICDGDEVKIARLENVGN
jgi:hypothetical protein